MKLRQEQGESTSTHGIVVAKHLYRSPPQRHGSAMKLLLGCGEISFDTPDSSGRTPLQSAAKGGYEGVVKLLLECNNIDPNLPDKDDWIPLLIATFGGHEGVLKLLLEQEEVNLDSRDRYDRTPLSLPTF